MGRVQRSISMSVKTWYEVEEYKDSRPVEFDSLSSCVEFIIRKGLEYIRNSKGVTYEHNDE